MNSSMLADEEHLDAALKLLASADAVVPLAAIRSFPSSISGNSWPTESDMNPRTYASRQTNRDSKVGSFFWLLVFSPFLFPEM